MATPPAATQIGDSSISFGGDGSKQTWASPTGNSSTGLGFVYENSQIITQNYTMTSNRSGMSVGPITIGTGITVTIPPGSRWVVL